MGQYYKIVNVTKKEYIEPSSLKLMEFAWTNNSTAELLSVLMSERGWYKEPLEADGWAEPESWAGDEVVVVGDYADDDSCLAHLWHKTAYKGDNLYADASNRYEDVTDRFKTCADYRYALNKTKGVYVDRYDGPVQYVSVSEDGSIRPSRIDPLVLLLAVGNGRGGGDYAYHARTCCDEVGSWVGDQVVCVDRVPAEGYEKSPVVFTEEEKIWRPTAGELVAAVAKADVGNVDRWHMLRLAELDIA